METEDKGRSRRAEEKEEKMREVAKIKLKGKRECEGKRWQGKQREKGEWTI